MTSVCRSTALIALAALMIPVSRDAAAQEAARTPDLLRELSFRSIGPAVTGGRVHDVEALPYDPSTIYLATASGGIWKTTNKGTTWTPVFDDQPVSTVGVVAIAPSNPQILWDGSGEQNNRQSTSWGNGVYRSLDGGASWTHLGLDETRHIAGIAVHPDDPDVEIVIHSRHTGEIGRPVSSPVAAEGHYAGPVAVSHASSLSSSLFRSVFR